MTRRLRRLAVRGIIAPVVVAAFVAGCIADPATPPPSATAADLPDATPTVTRSDLNATVWYAGYRLVFGTGVASLDPKGGTVTVDVAISNEGADTNGFDDIPIRLVAGTARVDTSRDTTIPDIPPGEHAAARLVFAPVTALPIATGSIIVGRDGDHQAVVPFVAGAAPVVDLKPVAPPLPAKSWTSAGTLRIALTAASLRADLPDWGDELPATSLAFTVTYTATYLGSFDGGDSFTAADIALKLPDGRTIAPRKDGKSQSNVLLLPNAPQAGLSTRFEIPSPATGTYTVIVKDGSAQAGIPFPLTGG